MDIVDRRPNPKGKNIENRQRFTNRERRQLKEAIGKSLGKRNLRSNEGQEITISDTKEPEFHTVHTGGKRQYVLPGNKHIIGEKIRRPPKDRNFGGGGPGGEGENDFQVTVDYKDFIQLFLEDMGLPDLLKETDGDEERTKSNLRGHAKTGSPHNIHRTLTAQNAFARRITNKRPNNTKLLNAEQKLEQLIASEADQEEIDVAQGELDQILERRKKIPYIDPIDLVYRRFEKEPLPSPQAVMFCLMDVSGSMDEHRQELAKRFFLLMKVFLEKKHKRLDIVFIRHTDYAKEVTEDKFFNDPETGGTVVSTVLQEMQRIIKERYPPELWNIYGAQISDGFNYKVDDDVCLRLMTEAPHGLLQVCQFFAYIQTDSSKEQIEEYKKILKELGMDDDDVDASLWKAYETLLPNHENFAMQKVVEKEDIVAVFAKLFGKQEAKRPQPARHLASLTAG